jgi:hypothetical protein
MQVLEIATLSTPARWRGAVTIAGGGRICPLFTGR